MSNRFNAEDGSRDPGAQLPKAALLRKIGKVFTPHQIDMAQKEVKEEERQQHLAETLDEGEESECEVM